jgi:hypothetical protein
MFTDADRAQWTAQGADDGTCTGTGTPLDRQSRMLDIHVKGARAPTSPDGPPPPSLEETAMYEIPNNLPIGEQNFETIRTDGLLYVDKTSYIRRNK